MCLRPIALVVVIIVRFIMMDNHFPVYLLAGPRLSTPPMICGHKTDICPRRSSQEWTKIRHIISRLLRITNPICLSKTRILCRVLLRILSFTAPSFLGSDPYKFSCPWRLSSVHIRHDEPSNIRWGYWTSSAFCTPSSKWR